MGDRQAGAGVLLDEQHRAAAPRSARVTRLEDGVPGLRVEAHRRLVHQDQPRLEHQRAGDLDDASAGRRTASRRGRARRSRHDREPLGDRLGPRGAPRGGRAAGAPPISRLSQTVISGKRLRSCGTWTIPRAARARGAEPADDLAPEARSGPARGCSSPLTAFSTVDLPAPFGPIEARDRARARASRSTPLEDVAARRSRRRTPSSSRTRSRPQVRVEDARVALHLGGRALGDLGAVVEHDHGVAEAHHERSCRARRRGTSGRARAARGCAAPSSRPSPGSRPAVGSSSSTSRGRLISTVANSSSFRWPNESSAGRRVAQPQRGRTRRALDPPAPGRRAEPRRRERAPPRLLHRGDQVLAPRVSRGKIRACWNVRVRPRRKSRVGSGRRTARAGEADACRRRPAGSR